MQKEFEVEKARAIAEALIKKAEKKVEGRFHWVEEAYTSQEGLLEQARGILYSLERNEIPFLGRYAEIGGTVIDHALIEKDGVHHLFYIRGQACTTWPESPTDDFGHAISKDLKSWKTLDPVLKSREGAWDSYQIWAPHIIYHEDEYWMFYTGVNYNVAQSIGLAKSKDLYKWERYGEGPVIVPGSWAVWSLDTWSDGRDPCILKDGDMFYAYYTATVYSAEHARNVSCIGVASSKNLYDWEDEGYIVLEESLNTPPESPFVVKKEGKYYLFYTDYKAGTVYAIADYPTKGFKDAASNKRVILAGVTASEIYESGGKWYISYISHEKNQLHFFEIKELLWEDGFFNTKEI